MTVDEIGLLEAPRAFEAAMFLGARCMECPIGPKGCLRREPTEPVMSEYHEGSDGEPTDEAIVVAGYPSEQDARAGQPFAGESGGIWNEGMRQIGKHRTRFALTYAMACPAPNAGKSGAIDKMLKSLDIINKDNVRNNLPTIPTPFDCCRPRLRTEISRFENIICLGKRAMHAVTGDNRSITKARGDFIEYDKDWRRITRDIDTDAVLIGHDVVSKDDIHYKVLPTLEPSFVAKAPGWRTFWYQDLGKAVRWFEDRLRWIEPNLLLNPTPRQFEDWLKVEAPFWVFDVETEYKDFLEGYLRCFGLATPDTDKEGNPTLPGADAFHVARSVGISLLSTDGFTRLIDADHEEEIFELTRWQMANRKRLKVGSNAGYVDRMVLSRFGSNDGPLFHAPVKPLLPWLPAPKRMLTVEPILDNLFLSRAWLPDTPKGLKVVGTALIDIGHWEGDKGAATDNDRSLILYNARGDCTVNARIIKPLVDIARERGYFTVIKAGNRQRRLEVG